MGGSPLNCWPLYARCNRGLASAARASASVLRGHAGRRVVCAHSRLRLRPERNSEGSAVCGERLQGRLRIRRRTGRAQPKRHDRRGAIDGQHAPARSDGLNTVPRRTDGGRATMRASKAWHVVVRRVLFIFLAAAGMASAWAQRRGVYPERPIRVVVPFPAGGAIDTIARHTTLDLARTPWSQ
jgi:hypothetical protein